MSHCLCSVQLHSERGIKYAKYLTSFTYRSPCRTLKETSYILTRRPLRLHLSASRTVCNAFCVRSSAARRRSLRLLLCLNSLRPVLMLIKHVWAQCLHLDEPTYCLDKFPNTFLCCMFFFVVVSGWKKILNIYISDHVTPETNVKKRNRSFFFLSDVCMYITREKCACDDVMWLSRTPICLPPSGWPFTLSAPCTWKIFQWMHMPAHWNLEVVSHISLLHTNCRLKWLSLCRSTLSVKKLLVNLCDLVSHSANAADASNNELSWMTKACMEA